MKRAHWKIFISHCHATDRLMNAVAKAAQHGEITNARAASLMRECEALDARLEELIGKIERAGVG